jgi:hypothetical protein
MTYSPLKGILRRRFAGIPLIVQPVVSGQRFYWLVLRPSSHWETSLSTPVAERLKPIAREPETN